MRTLAAVLFLFLAGLELWYTPVFYRMLASAQNPAVRQVAFPVIVIALIIVFVASLKALMVIGSEVARKWRDRDRIRLRESTPVIDHFSPHKCVGELKKQ